MKLLPSRRVLCTPYNHAPCHFMQSHIRKVYACLSVNCHLHFWQNDRGLLRATAVTRWWNGYRNKSQHRKLTLEKKILPPLLQGFEPATLTTELSPPHSLNGGPKWCRCNLGLETSGEAFGTCLCCSGPWLVCIVSSVLPVTSKCLFKVVWRFCCLSVLLDCATEWGGRCGGVVCICMC